MKDKIKKLVELLYRVNRTVDIPVITEMKRRIADHPNPFCRFGAFGFAQTDEDGLTLEILKRIGIEKGTFCEFGVGDGTENNTLILLAKGWRGFWVGGENISFAPPDGSRLTFLQNWILLDNIVGIYKTGCEKMGIGEIDVACLDLDGNDYHLIEALLQAKLSPKLFIAEYNAKFLPGIPFIKPYDAAHAWQWDDYFGGSLYSFEQLFRAHGYRLVCCNAASGANAFFVKEEYFHLFPEVPAEIERIYADPFYFVPARVRHKSSPRTVLQIIA